MKAPATPPRESRKVPVAELVRDERLQARAAVDLGMVEEYSAAYAAKAELPPPEVYEVDGVLYVVDGWHRVAAAHAAGVRWLRVAIVGTGTLDEAIWCATAANRVHGLRRTAEDKRRAVLMALETPIGQEQSSRAIADHCGVSDHFVSKVRVEWEAGQLRSIAVDDEVPAEPPKRRGKDGKLRRAPQRREATVELPPSVPQDDVEPLPFEPPDTARTAAPMPNFGPTLAALSAAIRGARLTCRGQVPEELVSLRQRVERLLSEAEHALEYTIPVVCPRCGGVGCAPCGRRGWATKGEAAR